MTMSMTPVVFASDDDAHVEHGVAVDAYPDDVVHAPTILAADAIRVR